MIYMPASLARQLTPGVNAVSIGGEGYNEWLVVAQDCIVSFQYPEKSRVIVFTPDGTAIYDSITDKGGTLLRKIPYLSVTVSLHCQNTR